MTDVKDIKVPLSYAPMEHFLTSMNLHAIGGTMLIALMHHRFIGKSFENIQFEIISSHKDMY